MPPASPTATVVVVTYNSAADIEACLTSLLRETRDTDLQVVVVDNASTDDTAAVVGSVRDPRVTVIPNEANVGFGAACNQGAALGDGEVVVLLNPDTVTHAGALDVLVRLALRPGVGPAGGRTLGEHGDLDPFSVQNAPTLPGTVAWASANNVWGSRLPGRLGTALGRNPSLLPTRRFERPGPVPVVIGCLLALRRADWEALGGFDERYFMYGEDVDLSLRARARGLTPTYTPDATITHLVGRSSATLARKLLVSLRGRATVMAVHWSPAAARTGQLLLVLGVGVRAVGERGRGPWSETWQRRAEWRRGYPAPTNGSRA